MRTGRLRIIAVLLPTLVLAGCGTQSASTGDPTTGGTSLPAPSVPTATPEPPSAISTPAVPAPRVASPTAPARTVAPARATATRGSTSGTTGGPGTPGVTRATAATDTATSSVATGACSAGTTVCVGAGQTHRTLAAGVAAARSGSVIELLPGTYRETVTISADNVTVRTRAGSQRAVITCAGLRPAQDKGCIVASGSRLTLSNLVITGAKGSQRNEACLRNEPHTNVVLRRIECYGSYNGVLASGGAWLIEDSTFHDNGAGDGQTHNLYLSGSCTSVIFRRSVSSRAVGGHAFKSRCARSTIEDSELRDNTVADAAEFSDGGDVTIRRTLITQPDGPNGNIVRHGAESCRHGGRLTLASVTIRNQRSQGYVRSACGPVTVTGIALPANVSLG